MAAAAAVEEENEVARKLLDVGKKLLSPLSDVEDLLKLLNLAEDLLSQVEQAPPASLNTALYRVLKALVAKDLLNHSEMDVKIALASCFSEITFITAPDHPYNEDLMKDVFRIIIDALKDIDDSSGRTYYKKVSILETMAKVHSCILMLDLDCDDLILEMFQHFLKTITPANEGRVFSFMETIMTELLNNSEDKLLPRLLESLVKDIKDGLPIARRLGQKVIGNCAGKLKPYLIKLVRSNGYGDIIASICQENYDILEMNLPSTSGECLEPGRLVPEVDSLKDMGTPADESLKETVLTNATVRRGSCDSVITSSSVKQKPESYCGIGEPEIATAAAIAELDTLNSIVVKSHGTVDSNIKKRMDQKENLVVQLNDTTSHFQRHDDKVLSVPSSRRDCIKEVSCHSSKGASFSDRSKGEILPSEDTCNQTIEENHASVGKPLRKSRKRKHGIAVGETKLVDLSQREADKTVKQIDSEAEKLCQTTTRRSSRNFERKLLEHNFFKAKQQLPNSLLKKDLAREKISKNYAVAELVDVPPKKTDKIIDSEGKDLCRTSIKRSTRKAIEMESLEHQKSKIEKLIGKVTIIDDLAERQSSKVSEAETPEKELDEALVGSKIKVWWPEDQEFYEGVVKSFDPVSKKHKVSYFDGDEEILFLKDESWKFLKDNAKSEFVWRQQKENPRADASPNSLNMVKRKDPVWEHCERAYKNDIRKLKCFHCSKIVSDPGRMKHHLARTGKGIVQPCTHASQEVEKLFRDMVSKIKPTKSVTSLGPTWEHCKKEAGYPRCKLKCVYCSKIVWGITRMKHHLARTGKGIVQPCTRASQEVEKLFRDMVSQIKPTKSVTSLDPTWDHCKKEAGYPSTKLKCLYCLKTVWGITTMKHHLARTRKNIVQPCTRASREVEKLFREMVSKIEPRKYVNSSDPTWDHCKKEAWDPSSKLKCVYCSKIVWGIKRMKYHLARPNKKSTPCSSCPQQVEDFFSNMISQLESRK